MKNNNLNIINFSNQVSTKPLFTVKLSDFGKSYLELDLFRQQVEWDRNNFLLMPFTATKKKILTYKSIFFGLGLLFFVLAVFIYMKTLAFPLAQFLLGSFHFARNLACGFCGFAGLASLLVCHSLSTEKEIVNNLSRKAHRDLSKLFIRKKIEHSINIFFNFGVASQKSNFLKQLYHETYDRIHDLKEETLHLFQSILMASHINGGKKEHLYNQVVLEMDVKLNNILLAFKETHP
jgi:hypothetical protein